MALLLAEARAETRPDQVRIGRRHQDVVGSVALVDPPRGRHRIQITHHLGVCGGLPGGLDPDVRSPYILGFVRTQQEANHLAVSQRHGTGRVLDRQRRAHLADGHLGILIAGSEQRLRHAVTTMPLGQQRSGIRHVLGVERPHLQAGHSRKVRNRGRLGIRFPLADRR